MNIINKMVWTIQRSQPGGWNDLDMLEVGNVSTNTANMVLAGHALTAANVGWHD
jgi:hypothetical protein